MIQIKIQRIYTDEWNGEWSRIVCNDLDGGECDRFRYFHWGTE